MFACNLACFNKHRYQWEWDLHTCIKGVGFPFASRSCIVWWESSSRLINFQLPLTCATYTNHSAATAVQSTCSGPEIICAARETCTRFYSCTSIKSPVSYIYLISLLLLEYWPKVQHNTESQIQVKIFCSSISIFYLWECSQELSIMNAEAMAFLLWAFDMKESYL